MVAPVKLHDEASLRVVHVGAAEKPAIVRAEIDLDLWARKASLGQQPSQSRLHL